MTEAAITLQILCRAHHRGWKLSKVEKKNVSFKTLRVLQSESKHLVSLVSLYLMFHHTDTPCGKETDVNVLKGTSVVDKWEMRKMRQIHSVAVV